MTCALLLCLVAKGTLGCFGDGMKGVWSRGWAEGYGWLRCIAVPVRVFSYYCLVYYWGRYTHDRLLGHR